MPDFDDLEDYLAIPRITALRLAPAGDRLVATVSTRTRDGKRFATSLWSVDPTGERPAQRLTWTAESVSAPAVLPGGDVLFLAKRPDPDPPLDNREPEATSLWLLPADGGEARRIAARRGGFAQIAVAADAGTIVVVAETLPAADDEDSDARLRKARTDLDVRAILHEDTPVRYWDADLGPGALRLLTAPAPEPGAPLAALRPLTPSPAPGRALDEQRVAVSRDGTTIVTGWSVADEPGLRRAMLVAVDVASGERRVLADEPFVSYDSPAVSPDGRHAVCVRETVGGYDEPPRRTLWIVDTADGSGRDLTPGADQWPSAPVFAADGTAVFYLSDADGRAPVFRVDVATGAVTTVAADGHYTDLCVAPDGRALYALRDRIDCPPTPVLLDPDQTEQAGRPLPAPGAVTVPGRVEEVEAAGTDGQRVRGWLVLPDGASADAPAPLLLWVHGGPLSSWNSWSWRWNPWLAAARGYAVLLPDPALSTGYGEKMIRRGWGQWGGAPYDDLMAITDRVVERPDVDAERTAAMGGSYGGYMANWIAGHTDRFRCIVTHASLWSLEAFTGTTDVPAYWLREWGDVTTSPERYEQFSPHRYADAITTPMLVIHGDKDYRVPVGEGLALWWELQRRKVESKFLYFPNENHWVLSPGGAIVWWETVLAWLATHVLDEPWERPALL